MKFNSKQNAQAEYSFVSFLRLHRFQIVFNQSIKWLLTWNITWDTIIGYCIIRTGHTFCWNRIMGSNMTGNSRWWTLDTSIIRENVSRCTCFTSIGRRSQWKVRFSWRSFTRFLDCFQSNKWHIDQIHRVWCWLLEFHRYEFQQRLPLYHRMKTSNYRQLDQDIELNI